MRVLLEAGADASLAMVNGSTIVDLVSGRGRAPRNEEALALPGEFGVGSSPVNWTKLR